MMLEKKSMSSCVFAIVLLHCIQSHCIVAMEGVVDLSSILQSDSDPNSKNGLSEGQPTSVDVTIDTSANPDPFSHFWSAGVGSGHAALTTRADWREHMRTGHDEAGFQFVRYHAVLDDTSMYFDAPSNNARGSYFNAFSTYEYLVSIGVRPVVELSFTPSPAQNGTCDHFYYKGCETVPTDYALYGEYVRNFTVALGEHFGHEEVRQWYFEVYNEADLHWQFDTYFTLYTAAAKAVKSADPLFRVGGPASAFPVWIEMLIKACKNASVPLDFVTSHAYPTTGGARESEVSGLMKQINNANQGAGGANRTLPLLITEWNGVCNSRGTWHDETAQPAFIVAAIDAVSTITPRLNMFAYWAISDVFTEMGLPADSVAFHGGFGLISLYGVQKPAFTLFSMLNDAGDTRLPATFDVQESNVTVIALLNTSTRQLRVFFAANGYVGETVPNRTINFKLTNGKAGAATTAMLWRIDTNNTNPKQLWESMGSPSYLKAPQIVSLKQAATPTATKVSLVPNKGGATTRTIAIELPAFGLAVLDVSL
eukprot:m.227211 g.227211  ORF g.227211 m.227211 type:complete len:538 (-) comp33516_c0_seq1:442-2055(-)